MARGLGVIRDLVNHCRAVQRDKTFHFWPKKKKTHPATSHNKDLGRRPLRIFLFIPSIFYFQAKMNSCSFICSFYSNIWIRLCNKRIKLKKERVALKPIPKGDFYLLNLLCNYCITSKKFIDFFIHIFFV